MIPINSIKMPTRFQRLCADWAGDMDCMLRAVSSTGGLTTGTICPVTDYTDDDDRDRKWYYSIWRDLSVDVGGARRMVGDDDRGYADLSEFEDWVDQQVDRLCESYGLDDWEE
jgi:hypothetical protein